MPAYNPGQILKLLKAALSDDDLHDLCFTTFRRVYDNFAGGQTRNMRQRLLVEYALRHHEVPRLLDEIKSVNPAAFADHESGLVVGALDVETKDAPQASLEFSSRGSTDVLNASLLTVGSVSLELWGDPSDESGRTRQEAIRWARENDDEFEAACRAVTLHIPDLNDLDFAGSAKGKRLGLEAVTLRVPLRVTNRGTERARLQLIESGFRLLDALRPPVSEYELHYRVSLPSELEPRLAIVPDDSIQIEFEVFLECRPRTTKPRSATGVNSTCNRIRVARWFANLLQRSDEEPLSGFQVDVDSHESGTSNIEFAISVTRDKDRFACDAIDINEVESNLQRVVKAGTDHFISLAAKDHESHRAAPSDMQPVDEAARTSAKPASDTRDFFVSYNRNDKLWAEWIAWTLEEAGYSVYIQAWDFRPGSNFVLEMHKATRTCEKTVVVLSDHYLSAEYTHAEWAAAFSQDPQGKRRMLVPVRVRPCQPDGLLAAIIYVDLLDLPEEDARKAILGAFSERGKPATEPTFPGTRVAPDQVEFPGEGASHPIASSFDLDHSTTVEQPDNSDQASIDRQSEQRLALRQSLNEMPSQQFNMLIFVVNPTAGIVPPMPAPQSDRSHALLDWAESPAGCGFPKIMEACERIRQGKT